MYKLENYFDYAATTPLNPKSLKAMQPYFSDNFFNPSAIYKSAMEVKADLDTARAAVAKELGCRPSEIIFTAGGSEANNLAISGVLKKWPKKHIVISAIEHDSVLNTTKNYNYSLAPVNKKGIIDIEKLRDLIKDNTVLVSVMLANNEIGAIQPIKDVASLVEEIRSLRQDNGNDTPLYLHTDACQAVNYLDVSTKRLGVDLMTINSGKIYGPKQFGALYVRGGVILEPIIYGGGQEKGLRSGTESVANAIGFAKSLEIVRKKSKSESKRLTELRDYLAKELTTKIPNVEINGPNGNKRLANNLHITIPSIDNERFLMELDELGIMVATGSACSASSDEPSHVLKAIGKAEDYIFSSLRITMGQFTTKQSVDNLVRSMQQILAK